MPYFPKAEAPNVAPYWCPNCAAWYLPQCGPVQSSCCVLHSPGSCCHYGETKLVAEGSQPQPAIAPTVWPVDPNGTAQPQWPHPYPHTWITWSAAEDNLSAPVTTNTLVAWGNSMMGGDTSHMVDS